MPLDKKFMYKPGPRTKVARLTLRHMATRGYLTTKLEGIDWSWSGLARRLGISPEKLRMLEINVPMASWNYPDCNAKTESRVGETMWGEAFDPTRAERVRFSKALYNRYGLVPDRLFQIGAYFTVDNRQFRQNQHYPESDMLRIESLAQRYSRLPLSPDTFKMKKAGAIGLELEFAGVCEDRRDVETPFWARLGTDISVHAPSGYRDLELRALVTEKNLEKRVTKMCEIMKSLGATLTRRCGVHVHLDARHLSMTEAAARARRLLNWLRLLRELVPENRRYNDFCRLESNVEEVINEDDYEEYSSRYYAVNFYSYPKFKSLEVRLHSGTLVPSKIVHWVRLMKRCMETAAPRRVAGQQIDIFTLLSTLKLSPKECRYWAKRHQELNPDQYAEFPGVEEAAESVTPPPSPSPSVWVSDESGARRRHRREAIAAHIAEQARIAQQEGPPIPPPQEAEVGFRASASNTSNEIRMWTPADEPTAAAAPSFMMYEALSDIASDDDTTTTNTTTSN